MDERACVLPEPVELASQAREFDFGKAGARAARKLQGALLIVVTEQQRGERLAAGLRARIAADHELLLAAALQLEPRPVATRTIRGAGILEDDTLKPLR